MGTIKDLVIVALSILVGYLTYSLFYSHGTLREYKNLVESTQAEVETWRDEEKRHLAKINQMTSEKAQIFIDLKTKDSSIIALQETVEEYKEKLRKSGSVTNIDSDTNIDNKGKTNVNARDTVYLDNVIYIYPEYSNDFNLDEWVYGSVVANKDSTQVSVKIKNSYSVVLGREGGSLFKKSKPFALVRSENPFTEIKELKSYQVSLPKPKRWSFGPSLSYGIGENLNTQIIIGVSLQYSLIRF